MIDPFHVHTRTCSTYSSTGNLKEREISLYMGAYCVVESMETGGTDVTIRLTPNNQPASRRSSAVIVP